MTFAFFTGVLVGLIISIVSFVRFIRAVTSIDLTGYLVSLGFFMLVLICGIIIGLWLLLAG